MSDYDTESFTPYEPQTQYDWDYGDEPAKEGGAPPNILWGRVAVLGVFALLLFLIGRWSAPNGIDEARLQELNARYDQAQDEIKELKAAAAQTAIQPTPSVTVGEQTDTADDATFDGKVYTVLPGDTMRDIADRFCGDPAKDDLIADFNGIADPTLIRQGQELKIPEDCAK